MTDALVRYRESVETRRLAAADKAIFQGLLSLRTHRGDARVQWPYGKRNSRDGGTHDPSNVIYIPVPILIEQGDFDRVQAKLARSNPKTTHHASSMALTAYGACGLRVPWLR